MTVDVEFSMAPIFALDAAFVGRSDVVDFERPEFLTTRLPAKTRRAVADANRVVIR